jgi:formylglycine-generating enzyme required for sulfatase activity
LAVSRRSNLEQHIRESYALVREYEEQGRLSSDPKERARCKREIAAQWALIQEQVAELWVLGGELPEDIRELAAALVEKPALVDSPSGPEKTPAAPWRPELYLLSASRQPYEPEMVLIPAGEFLMGSDGGQDSLAYEDELPQLRQYLPDYAIGRTATTNAQYSAFVRATGHRAPERWSGRRPPNAKESHPVVYVSWEDALAYCYWLAEATGRPYTLPSEAEWEKAARGTDGRVYPWGNEWDARRCNTAEGGRAKTAAVGTYPDGASPYGALDMAGNVWEWTRSAYRPYPYRPDDGREDQAGRGPRVLRGGAFDDSQRHARCACRNWNDPFYSNWLLGFRVAWLFT